MPATLAVSPSRSIVACRTSSLRHDPLGAELGELAVLELDREDPAPHALARLEHDHRDPGVVEVEGGGQPREPRPDDHHISHVSARSALDWLA